MKTVGIVGGLGPESTIDYYRGIISLYRNRSNSDENPAILINSIDIGFMLKLVKEQNWEKLTNLLVSAVEKLCRAGADFAAIASNTPHIVFDAVRERSSIPMISIVEQTANEAFSVGSKRTLLLGTLFTMQADFYQRILEKHGIQIVVPNPDERSTIQNIIFPDLENGIVIPEKKKELIAIIDKYATGASIDSVILGCTELPLMIKDQDLGIKVFNTAGIHIKEIVELMLHS